MKKKIYAWKQHNKFFADSKTPFTRIRLGWKRRFFLLSALPSTRLGENGPSGKTHLFKHAPFKSGFPFTCGRTKTEVFEYDGVIHHILLAFKQMPCQGSYRISIVLAFSCGRSKTIRIRYAVHVDIHIFENGGKNLRFQKYPDACRTEPKTSGSAWYSTKIRV